MYLYIYRVKQLIQTKLYENNYVNVVSNIPIILNSIIMCNKNYF